MKPISSIQPATGKRRSCPRGAARPGARQFCQIKTPFGRFVTCAERRMLIKPSPVRAYCAMTDSRVLIPPAVFKPGKPQASPHRDDLTPIPVIDIHLTSSEIFRGKISRQKINPTSKKGRY
jgi:hypothetical protein